MQSFRFPVVTGHAVRRFAERVLGIAGLPESDAEAMRIIQKDYGIDTAEVRGWLEALVWRGVSLQACSVTFGGLRFVLDGPKLMTVTVAPRKGRRKRRVFDDDRD